MTRPASAAEDRASIIRALWGRIEARDWAGAQALLAVDFTCEWPETRERFASAAAWIGMNQAYPTDWRIEVLEVVEAGPRVVSRVRVSDETGVHHASSFWTVEGGRARELLEFWTKEGGAVPPAWRQAFTSTTTTAS